jgi:hypothetical protein
VEKLKKNWKPYLIIVLIAALYFTLSYQYNYYLEEDVISFSIQEKLIIAGCLFLISIVTLFLVFSSENDGFIRVAKSFAYSVFITLFGFFILQEVIISGGLLINRLGNKSAANQILQITNIGNNGTIRVRASKNKNADIILYDFSKSDLKNAKKGGYVFLEFKRGLLGITYIKSKEIR